MSTLFLRGVEFELDTLSIDAAINPRFMAITVSAMSPDGDGGSNRMFAHTHFEDLEPGEFPDGFEEIVKRAVASFKEAIGETGGWIAEDDQEEE